MPYIFWLIIGIAVALFLNFNLIYEYETYKQWQDLNGPIWFLLALFEANVIFFHFSYFFRGYKLFICIIIVSLIGIYLKNLDTNIPFEIDRVFQFLPFFYMGFIIKNKLYTINKLKKAASLKFGLIFIIISYSLFYLFKIDIFANSMTISSLVSYINSGCFVIGFLFLCNTIKWLPIISYIGRYSIIILCIHWPILNIFRSLPQWNAEIYMLKFILLISFIILCWTSVPICKKFLPFFVAQKNLFTYKTTNQNIISNL